MIRINSLLIGIVFSALSLVACGGDSGDGTVKRDSAGIQIVMSPGGGRWSDADRPKFSAVMNIGGNAADTNYQFGAVTAIDIDADGNIYVLDTQAQVVRVFDSQGKFLRTIGRKGSGPGELTAATALFVTAGDTLLVADVAAGRLLRFGTDGSPRGAVEMSMSNGLSVKWIERDDGSLVVQTRPFDIGAITAAARAGGSRGPGVPAAPDGSPPVDRLIVRTASGTVVDTLMMLPGGQTMQVGGRAGITTRIFAAEPMWSISRDGGVFFGVNDEYSINVYDSSGVLKRIVRRDVERKPVTEDAKTAIKTAMMKLMQEAVASRGMTPTPAMMDMMASMIAFADYFPSVGNLFGGPNGTLWVQQALTAEELTKMAASGDLQNIGSTKWDVYNRDGVLLGEVHMPDDFTPLRWIGDKLVGVQSDANGTPRVAIMKVSGLCSDVEVAGKACI